MLDPRELYEVTDQGVTDQDNAALDSARPVMLFSLTGFIDAGHAARLATEHLLQTLDHELLAVFDVDQLYDYRARRPVMTFDTDHWVDYATPTLQLHRVRDLEGTEFLLLSGPEPDLQWERFNAAVIQLVERFDVRLSIGLHAIPMGVPHTRPVGVIPHATRADLVPDQPRWVGRVQVPGHAIGLLEFRLGQASHDAAGFAVQVPHYLAQNEYPVSAQVLLESAGRAAGLKLPTQALATAGEEMAAMIAEQIAEQSEIQAMVEAMEEQYDALVGGATELGGLAAEDLPTADELGAELERFLAAENDRRGRRDS